MLICIFASISSVLGRWCEMLKERIFMLLCMCALYINSKLFCFWVGLHKKLSSEFRKVLTSYFECKNIGQVHEMNDFLFIFYWLGICLFLGFVFIWGYLNLLFYYYSTLWGCPNPLLLFRNWAIPAKLWWIVYVFPKCVCYYTLEPYSCLSYLIISEVQSK